MPKPAQTLIGQNEIITRELVVANATGYDVYIDKSVIHLVSTVLSDKLNKKTEIYYTHSNDFGLTWSQPVSITKQIDLPVISRLGNDVQIAARGEELLISWETSGEIPSSGPLLTARSIDAGVTWQLASKLAGDNSEQSHADIVVDEQGVFSIVWLDDREENGYQGLRYAKSEDVGLHWLLENTIDATTCSCCWNRVFVNQSGQLNVLYRNMEYRDMVMAQSRLDASQWYELSTVGDFNWKFDGCPHNGGGVAQSENSLLHSSVWTGVENKQGLYYLYSTDLGHSWSKPVLIDKGGFHSDVAVTQDNAVIIWDSQGRDGSKVFYEESVNNGQDWSRKHLLSTEKISASFPRILATDLGWLAFWVEQDERGDKNLLSALIMRAFAD